MTIDAEIAEQPDALRRAIASARDAAPAVTAAAAGRGTTHVVIAARGSSDNAARHAQYVWGPRLRVPVGLATPSLYAPSTAPRLDGALVVGVSQSGASPDLVAVLAEARRQGRPTVAVTNEPDSPLARTAEAVVPLDVGPEHAVAATKTYTGQLAALDVLVDALAEALGLPAPATRGLDDVPDAVAAVLRDDPATPAVLAALDGHDRCAVVGRGTDLATAGEWALKLQELAGVLAHHWSTADFRHGPFALAAAGLPVLLLGTDPTHRDEVTALAADLVDAGAPPLLLTDDPPADATHPVVHLPAGDHTTGAHTAVVAAQLATVALTRTRGRDPDRPALIHKVTRTR